jgi:hypothetical protein
MMGLLDFLGRWATPDAAIGAPADVRLPLTAEEATCVEGEAACREHEADEALRTLRAELRLVKRLRKDVRPDD